MRTSTRGLAIILLASLALTGCSQAAPDEGSSGTGAGAGEITTAPATGPQITGTGYHFAAPEGWDTLSVPGFSADAMIADQSDADGFADNMNVLKSPAGVLTIEQIESAGVDELEGGGATDVQVRPHVVIAGDESAHLSATLSQMGATYVVEQYYPSNDEATYVATFSFSESVSEADRTALAESVLATWTWD